jgi:hypothetical protein
MSLYARDPSGSTPVPPAHGRPWDLQERVEAEFWVLDTDEGRRLLAQVAAVTRPGPADLARWRRLAPAPAVAAAIRLAGCRLKARAKFSLGDQMWLDPVGLEQATSEVVARHKAARFQAPVVVDLCAGIGGDAVSLADRSHVLAVDLDHDMCRRITWNARVHDVGERVLPCQGRAETFAIPRGAWVHVDPDRRASGKGRARKLDDYAPGLEFLKDLVHRAPAGAIKLSPASDFASHFVGLPVELELISLSGECKEATVWFGSTVTCRRRATRLPENVTWTDRDGDPSAPAPVAPVSAYVYDPDPALIRAGLLDSFAAEHGVSRIAANVDYLTSDHLIRTPFLSAFEVQSIHAFDIKQLRRILNREEIGTLEIKLRGLNITSERLRSLLHPRGSRCATLIVAAGKSRACGIIARRS